ncbi:hypothetical protein RKE29_09890 [Streptomyces sp. B1866]|uniref:hypothetical protein n=1 Tax=Streptomyces sp. B1866 TaxID=3075431 RepID=UPI00288EFCE5|nr:hypothetical protein [Streptomyces sp. B1866]MDT3396953.1 hypothetical protein [Streptomyces sp. B1866]
MSRKHSADLPLRIVDFLDTSILLELLDVPHRNAHRAEVTAEMERRRQEGVSFVLPAATVIETGNHVFQVDNGHARRECARRFTDLLRATAAHKTPWMMNEHTWDSAFLTALCEGGTTGIPLTEHAVRKLLGAGDLSIVAERDLFARRVAARVRIWTLERTMQAYADPP